MSIEFVFIIFTVFMPEGKSECIHRIIVNSTCYGSTCGNEWF